MANEKQCVLNTFKYQRIIQAATRRPAPSLSLRAEHF